MQTLSKPQKLLAVMFDLCKGEPKALQYEDIVVTAFTRYPEDFQLRGYPQYPDSSDIHKPLYKMSWLLCNEALLVEHHHQLLYWEVGRAT